VRLSRLLVPLLVMLLLALGASSASAVIVHLENGTTLSYQPAPGASSNGSASGARVFDEVFKNLDYSGGPVMPSNMNYTIYWSPSGASAYPLDFISGVNTYFKDLEHDSGGHENVESVATQYNDAAGQFAQYNSKFGGSFVDEHPYPKTKNCKSAPICLTDAQIHAELKRFVLEQKLPTDLEHEYFLLTPEGVESCFEEAGLACSANAEKNVVYCAYHGSFEMETGLLVYSNDPFVNLKTCDEKEHHINGPSDSALFGGLSHEHNESITDPEPNNAWTDWTSGASSGYENGDKCRTLSPASEFGTPLGKTEGEGKVLMKYNQEIAGHRYWYQQEWSNKGHTCLQRLTFAASEAPAATFTRSASSGNEVTFNAAGSATGPGVRYVWQFNDFNGHEQNETEETESVTIKHVFAKAEPYTVALTVLLSDGTSKGTAKQVLVPGSSQTVAIESTSPASATFAGATYSVAASATSGLPVALTVDASSSSVCSISGATVSFIGVGTCTIDANQKGNGEVNEAAQAQQSFAVGKGSQTSAFTSSPPATASVGGAAYTATATASSGLPVTVSSLTPAVCTFSGATVSFVAAGSCSIAASQAGNVNYNAAAQVAQTFKVGSSSFSAISATVNAKTGAITFTEKVSEPGTFSWLLTFQNGKFGVFASRATKCKAGQTRLNGKCRPSRIVFAKGSQNVAAPGTVRFTLKPSSSALKALRNALKRRKGLAVSETLTFQSSGGGPPVSQTKTLTVKLKKR
jgi:hypothetical protein